MLFDTLFNIVGLTVIIGAPLMWIAGWIMLTYKADRFVHRQFEPPARVPTAEEKAAALVRVMKMMAAEQADAHHH